MAKILYIIAQEGFQDVEYKDSRDVLEDAGHEITVASITESECTGKYGMKVKPDTSVAEANERLFDAIVVIGGPGTPQLGRDPATVAVVKQFYKLGKLVAAICMAPALVLTRSGIVEGKNVTSFQTEDGSSKSEVIKARGTFVNEPVVKDGNIITAEGPEAAKDFGKAIVEYLS